ncbi:MAG: hypothetical protein B6244_01670 [Candidatus Cloacimonetes bacterium 4572_55]|nr:MAG: hypothetical protein B6244_01670 [Candidatus Cloacimonetes bacterium 4572_55]
MLDQGTMRQLEMKFDENLNRWGEKFDRKIDTLSEDFHNVRGNVSQLEKNIHDLKKRVGQLELKFGALSAKTENSIEDIRKMQKSIDILAKWVMDVEKKQESFRQEMRENYRRLATMLENATTNYNRLNQEQIMGVEWNKRQDKRIDQHNIQLAFQNKQIIQLEGAK